MAKAIHPHRRACRAGADTGRPAVGGGTRHRLFLASGPAELLNYRNVSSRLPFSGQLEMARGVTILPHRPFRSPVASALARQHILCMYGIDASVGGTL